jgi:diadenylate cyclase
MDFIFSSLFIQIVRNILDILCVAYLLYFLYKLFEDTNSISIIKGFIVVAAIYIAAKFIELKTLAWIFQYVVGYFVILVVILFQPEIRKVLSRIGQSGIAGIRTRFSTETLGEITEAAYAMSKSGTGGLIIIEQKVGLKQLLDESILLDAGVKAELLLAIFHKGGVLHDGAVLIEGERIIAAQVIVPSIKLDALLKTKAGVGTRHRAGVAVTIDSDAIAIIVSEENGAVSIAYKGKLEYELTQEKFLRRIHEVAGLE